MCNAWNHPSGCTCGWGGEGHLGGGGYRGSIGAHPPTPTYVVRRKSYISNRLSSFDSFVNPNATCPVCGEAVFYYQSPHGGRVFFDALGPPWPKHPCTDNGTTPNYIKSHVPHTPWKFEGWAPFIVKKIQRINNQSVKIIGKLDHSDNKLQLFADKDFYCNKKTKANLFHIKYKNENSYFVSTFSINKINNKTIKEHTFIASLRHIKRKPRMKPTLNNKKKTEPTLMELALKKAFQQ